MRKQSTQRLLVLDRSLDCKGQKPSSYKDKLKGKLVASVPKCQEGEDMAGP